MGAIIFKTNQIPKEIYSVEVLWDKDVEFTSAKEIDIQEAIKLIRNAPYQRKYDYNTIYKYTNDNTLTESFGMLPFDYIKKEKAPFGSGVSGPIVKFYMDINKDEFIHFTNKERIPEILEHKRLLMNSGYDRYIGKKSIYAVSAVWGLLHDTIQLHRTSDTEYTGFGAIIFKTNVKPKRADYRQVIWYEDVPFTEVKEIPLKEAINLLNKNEEKYPSGFYSSNMSITYNKPIAINESETSINKTHKIFIQKDVFIHFTLKNRVDEIIKDKCLKCSPPYRKGYDNPYVFAVSTTIGRFNPDVQLYKVTNKDYSNYSAILFKTNNIPCVADDDQILWDKDVQFNWVKEISIDYAINLLTNNKKINPDDYIVYTNGKEYTLSQFGNGILNEPIDISLIESLSTDDANKVAPNIKSIQISPVVTGNNGTDEDTENEYFPKTLSTEDLEMVRQSKFGGGKLGLYPAPGRTTS